MFTSSVEELSSTMSPCLPRTMDDYYHRHSLSHPDNREVMKLRTNHPSSHQFNRFQRRRRKLNQLRCCRVEDVSESHLQLMSVQN